MDRKSKHSFIIVSCLSIIGFIPFLGFSQEKIKSGKINMISKVDNTLLVQGISGVSLVDESFSVIWKAEYQRAEERRLIYQKENPEYICDLGGDEYSMINFRDGTVNDFELKRKDISAFAESTGAFGGEKVLSSQLIGAFMVGSMANLIFSVRFKNDKSIQYLITYNAKTKKISRILIKGLTGDAVVGNLDHNPNPNSGSFATGKDVDKASVIEFVNGDESGFILIKKSLKGISEVIICSLSGEVIKKLKFDVPDGLMDDDISRFDLRIAEANLYKHNPWGVFGTSYIYNSGSMADLFDAFVCGERIYIMLMESNSKTALKRGNDVMNIFCLDMEGNIEWNKNMTFNEILNYSSDSDQKFALGINRYCLEGRVTYVVLNAVKPHSSYRVTFDPVSASADRAELKNYILSLKDQSGFQFSLHHAYYEMLENESYFNSYKGKELKEFYMPVVTEKYIYFYLPGQNELVRYKR